MLRRLTSPPGRALRLCTTVVVALVVLVTPASAFAHDEGETTVGYELVLQAIGHLSHGSGHVAMDEAMEKIHDALDTTDNAGVNVALVKQAEAALEAEDVMQARALLQQSIVVALSSLPPATGEETGTKVVLLPLRGRGGLGASDWAFLAVAAVLLLFGVGLAVRYRPRDSVHEIQVRLSGDGEATP